MILIDNGHGENTPGKRSPDGRLREYLYTREIAEEVVADLRRRGYEAERIVRENIDVALATRVRRVNDVCKELGSANVLLVSIHVDAAGDGSGWMQAGGWSAYTTPGRTKSDRLAECLYDAASKHLEGYAKIQAAGKEQGLYSLKQTPIRTDLTDGDRDKEANFFILKNTLCAAVLTENLFQDNRSDVEFLLSPAGRRAIVSLHVEGIVNYLSSSPVRDGALQ